MGTDPIIREAQFDPNVRKYWLTEGALVLTVIIVGIPLLLVWIPLGLYLTRRYLDRMACVLTTKSLKVKKGLWVRVEKTIPLEKITDMALVQGPLMRWFKLYKLTVETAGQSGPGGALVSLTGVVDAKSFREAVLVQRESAASVPASEATPISPGPVATTETMKELTDSVTRIEALLRQHLAPDDPR